MELLALVGDAAKIWRDAKAAKADGTFSVDEIVGLLKDVIVTVKDVAGPLPVNESQKAAIKTEVLALLDTLFA